MVAIVAGQGLGLQNTSKELLGGGGVLGDASAGVTGEKVYVNASTGNLVVRQQDEWLVGLGPDAGVLRTYNSQGLGSDDNGDNWRLGLSRRIIGLPGGSGVNTVGSSVKRIGEDGEEAVYTWDASRSLYASKSGAGAYDTLSYSAGVWTWTDGDTRIQDIYEVVSGTDARLKKVVDPDGNQIQLTYAGTGSYLITQIQTWSASTSSGEQLVLAYDSAGGRPNNLKSITTTYLKAASGGGTTSVESKRVSYTYESTAPWRLSSVKVDLTPLDRTDDSAADKVYITSYTYVDSSSNRLQSITQPSGGVLTFTYDAQGRVKQIDETLKESSPTVGGGLTTRTTSTTLNYDVVGTTKVTDALGQVTELVYETTAGQSQNQLKAMRAYSAGSVVQERQFTYNGNGDVTQVRDGLGNVTVYEYDANGNRTYERDAQNNVVRRTYSATSKLLTQSSYRDLDPDGAGAVNPSQAQTTRHVYETAAGKTHQLRFVISAEGRVTESRYNALGQEVSTLSYPAGTYSVGALAVDAVPTLTAMVSWAAAQPKSTWQRTDFVYNARGQLDKSTSYATVDASTGLGVTSDNSHSVTQYVYDQAGNLLQKIDGRSHVTTYQYDGLNRIISVKDASDQTATTLYQDNGSGIYSTVKTANGLVTTAAYDSNGRVLSVARSHPDTGTLGTTTYTYDKLGRLIATSLPTGETSYIVYDALGRKVAEVDGEGSMVEYRYNGESQVVLTHQYAVSLLLSSNASKLAALKAAVANHTNVAIASIRPAGIPSLDRVQWRVYDKAGRLTHTISTAKEELSLDLRGAVTEYRHDGAGRVTQTLQYATMLSKAEMASIRSAGANLQGGVGQITVAGTVMSLALNELEDRRVRSFYDKDARLVGQLDGQNYYTSYTYDGAGQLVRTSRYAMAMTGSLTNDQTPPQLIDAGQSTGGAAAVVRTYDDQHTYAIYNARGQLSAQIDAESYVTQYEYDAAGNITREHRRSAMASQQSAPNSIALGQAISDRGVSVAAYVLASSEDHTTTFGYDKNNRLERRHEQPTGLVTTYAYDVQTGLLLRSTVAAENWDARSTQRRYDKLGRLTHELGGEGSKALAELPADASQEAKDAIWNSYGTRHEYDTSGHRVATITPNGVDGSGLKTVFYYDKAGRQVYSINALGEVTATEYNAFGDVSEVRREARRLSDIAELSADIRNLSALQGGLLKAAAQAVQDALALTSANDLITNYSYSNAGRLQAVIKADGAVERYTYNAFGERLQHQVWLDASGMTSRVTSRVYDRRGLVQTIADGDQDNALLRYTQQRHDAFGRLIQTTDARSNVRTQSYDKLGRVVTINEPGSDVLYTLMSYDAFGRMVAMMDAQYNWTTYTHDDVARTLTITTPENVSTVTQFNLHGQQVALQDGRGNVTYHDYNKDGQLTGRHVIDAETNFLSFESSEYDKAGRISRTYDQRGQAIDTYYDAANRVLTRVQDADGANPLKSEYRYDALGNAVWSRDAAGTWTQTSHDEMGRVTSVVVDPAQVPGSEAGSAATGSSSFALEANPRGQNALQQRTEFSYAKDGSVLSVRRGVRVDPQDASKTIALQEVAYHYDSLGRRSSEVLDPNGLKLTTSYTYDDNDNVVARKNALDQITRYVYNADNKVVLQIDASGAVQQTDYDTVGNISRTIAYANRIDLTGQPKVMWESLVRSKLPSTPGAQDQVNYLYHDSQHRLVRTMDALGYVTERQYDQSGNVSRITRYVNRATNLQPNQYAQSDRLDFEWPDVEADTVNGADQVEQFVYDGLNRITAKVDALGYVTGYGYEIDLSATYEVRFANKLVYVGDNKVLQPGEEIQFVDSAPTDPSGPYVLIKPSKDQDITHFHDKRGLEVDTVDALGYHTVREFDELGRLKTLTRMARILSTDASDADNAVTRYTYDAAGNLTEVTDAEGVKTRHVYDAAGNRTETTLAFETADASTTGYGYDDAGRLTSETRAKGTDDEATTTYVLDALGQRKEIIDPLSHVTKQDFDEAGRVKKVTDPLDGQTLTEYDAFGNAVKVTDPNGNSGYFYFDGANRNTWQIDPMGYATQTEYNRFGQAERITKYDAKVQGTLSTSAKIEVVSAVPSPLVAGTVYVLTNADKDATTVIEHDKLGRQTKITDAENHSEHMAYDGLGNKIEFTNKLGGVFKYTHDKLGRVSAERQPVTVKQYDDQGVAKVNPNQYAGLANTEWWVVTRFNYDSRGNVIKKTEAEGLAEQRVTEYGYDKLDRLKTTTGQAMATYTVAGGEQEDQIPTETRTYDNRGNLIEVKAADGGRTLTYYDALNRKVAEVSPEGTLSAYTFDKAGNVKVQRTYATRIALPATAGGDAPVGSGESRAKYFDYDDRGRLLTETVKAAVVFTQQDGASEQDLVVRHDTDSAGNITLVTDARGNKTVSIYDKRGNKTAEVNALGFVVTWQHDAAGNVSRKVQYDKALSATQLSATQASRSLTGVDLATLDTGKTRITEYGYDRLNRLTAESKLGVVWSQIDEITGNKTDKTSEADTTVTTRYTHDALGNVKTQTDAAGAVTTLHYDSLGRLIKAERPQYKDQNGNTVKPTTETSYNALGQRTLEVQRGSDPTSETDDRFTRFTYDKQGNVLSESQDIDDTRKAVTRYQYDLAGRVTLRSIDRRDADGNSHTDRALFEYDREGHQVKQTLQSKAANDTDWTQVQTLETQYNAFGDIDAKGTFGGWQEKIEYDNVGRVWRTNSGTDKGAIKVHYYDQNGNLTLTVSSTTVSLRDQQKLSDASLLSLGALLDIDGVNAQVGVFNAANQRVSVVKPVGTHAPGSNDPYASEKKTVGKVEKVIDGGAFASGSLDGARFGHQIVQVGSEYKTIMSIIGGGFDPAKPIYLLSESQFQGKYYRSHYKYTSDPYLEGVGNSLGIPGHKLGLTVIEDGQVASCGDFAELYQLVDGKKKTLYYSTFSGPRSYSGFGNAAELMVRDGLFFEPLTFGRGRLFDGLTVAGIPRNVGGVAALKFYAKAPEVSLWTELPSRIGYVGGAASATVDFSVDTSGLNPGDYDFKYEAFLDDQKTVGAKGVFSVGQETVDLGGWYEPPPINKYYDTAEIITQRTSKIVRISAEEKPDIIQNWTEWLAQGFNLAHSDVESSWTYNAFGELISDAKGGNVATTYDYNNAGKLIRQTSPEVAVRADQGGASTTQQVAPTTKYFYDQVGRLVGTEDANGNLSTKLLLAGSSADNAITLVDFNADRVSTNGATTGAKRYGYDEFGNMRLVTDELWDGVTSATKAKSSTLYEYDKLGRLTKVDRHGQFDDAYEYDEVGNRIAHTSASGSSDAAREKAFFDALSRVKSTVSATGYTVDYEYLWSAQIAGGGGWRKTTRRDGKTLIDDVDTFGRLRWHKDMGDRAFTYLHNDAGLLVRQTSLATDAQPAGELAVSGLKFEGLGQDISFEYYENGLTKSVIDKVAKTWAHYRYDASGNRVFEGYAKNFGTVETPIWEYYQYSDATFDAAGRITSVKDARSDISYEYDAVGNRVRVKSVYHDGLQGGKQTQDYWYAYDKMNRFVITMGTLDTATNQVVVGTQDGRRVEYNAAGQRVAETTGSTGLKLHYGYNEVGLLNKVGRSRDAGGNVTDLVAERVYDARGNVKTLIENGSQQRRHEYVYAADNRLKIDTEWVGSTAVSETRTDYYTDQRGSETENISTVTFKSLDGKATNYTTQYQYAYWDSAKKTSITSIAGPKQRGDAVLEYDSNGHLLRFHDVMGNKRYYYTTDADGRVLRREEVDGPNAGPQRNNRVAEETTFQFENYYFFNGRQIGNVSYMKDSVAPRDYVQALSDRDIDYSNRKPVSSADFDQNYMAIGPDYPGKTSTTYTVSADGETLQGIAQAMWGDGSMWYLIAEANGLFGAVNLKAGERLIIPNKVTNIHNNSTTSRPYDAADAMGDVNPTLPPPPPPPKKKGCGGAGMVLMIVVAVVATVFTAGVAAAGFAGGFGSIMSAGVTALGAGLGGSLGVAGFALAGAVGSAASQLVGMATGNVDKFSWSAVAQGAVSSVVGAALPGVSTDLTGWQAAGAHAGRAALGSVATQGASMAMGLQKKFSWTAVAASAAGGAAGYGAGQALDGLGVSFGSATANAIGYKTVQGMASGWASATVRHEKPDWAAIAADSFGSAVGDALVASVVQKEQIRTRSALMALDVERAATDRGLAAATLKDLADSGKLNEDNLRALLSAGVGTAEALVRVNAAKAEGPQGLDNLARQLSDKWLAQSERGYALSGAVLHAGGLDADGQYADAANALGLNADALRTLVTTNSSASLSLTDAGAISGELGQLGLAPAVLHETRLAGFGDVTGAVAPYAAAVNPALGGVVGGLAMAAHAFESMDEVKGQIDRFRSLINPERLAELGATHMPDLGDKAVKELFGEAVETAVKVTNRLQDKLVDMLQRSPNRILKATGGGLDRLSNAIKARGELAEGLVKYVLDVSGLAQEGSVHSVQNRSGHGIDVMYQPSTGKHHGKWAGLEVKTTVGTSGDISYTEGQSRGAHWFIQSTLEKAANARGVAYWPWEATRGNRAEAVLSAMEGERFTGHVIEITKVNSANPKASVYEWNQISRRR